MNPIYIVGVGPGALDLMTLRALDRLKQAEVLVWADSLIPPQISALAPDECERIRTSSLTLEEILNLLIDKHKTNFIKEALKNKLKVLFGIEMLILQAAPAFKIWFCIEPHVTEKLLQICVKKLKK